jgi:ABC-type transport system involved in cytochrome c biogenesis permease subunit
MSFFKKYNGTTNLRLARLETLIWTLIYGGLLTLVVGLFMGRREEGRGTDLVFIGIAVALVGAVLVYVRSRMREEH